MIALNHRSLLLALSLMLLGGCHADLDWRKLASEEGRFQMLMPARSQSETRNIGAGATMTLWTASARDSVFGISITDYPDAASLHVTEARDALARNVTGSVSEDRAGIAAPKGAPAGAIAAESRRIAISGSTGEAGKDTPRPVSVHARLYAIGNRLYQLTIITRPDTLTASDLEMFFYSFELSYGR